MGFLAMIAGFIVFLFGVENVMCALVGAPHGWLWKGWVMIAVGLILMVVGTNAMDKALRRKP